MLRQLKHRRRQARSQQPSTVTAGVEAPGNIRKSESTAPRPTIPLKLDPRRRVLFIVIALVVLPVLLLGVLEGGLRLAGYGYATAFFKPLRIGNEDYLVENDKFGWRFFPPEISRSPTPTRMLAHKPKGTHRIFLLGESAALGDPEPAFGMGRYLQVLLEERYPETRFEVIPAAMTAINSHAVLPIARECASHEGDLWIIYMGNNEMIGPFGAITVFGSQAPPLWYARMSLALQRTRIGQLLTSLGRRLTGASGEHGPSWGGMQMFLKNQIAPGDRRKERVYEAFQRNLEDILRAGRSAHVPVILSTVAVNLKDCAPFGSLPGNNVPGYDTGAFEKLQAQGMQAQTNGDFAQGAASFEQAARLNPAYAEAQFRWGQCLLGLTNNTAAREHFQQACDDDSLPFRTDSRMNAVIIQTARKLAGPDLALFDAASVVCTNSADGICGEETFYEHVHFNFDGNYRMALGLARQVASFLPGTVRERISPAWATQETCEKDLGLTDWNRRDVYDGMRRRFLQPPFTAQPENVWKAKAWEKKLVELQLLLTPTNAEPARQTYIRAIAREPDDFRLHMNYAAFLEESRSVPGAVSEWKKVQELLPHHYLAAYEIGRLLAEEDKSEDARVWLSKALRLRPDLSEGWYELGRIQGASGQFQPALTSFDRARRLVPGEPRYHCEMAKALVKLQRRDEAIVQLEEAIHLSRNYWEAHYLLGEQLAFSGRIPEARGQFEETLRLKPGYPMAHFNLGVAMVKQGQLTEARREFEEVLRLDSENRLARQALAQLQSVQR
ncbi:MAG TPA: tetratricopeptide repeat protein [Patescibacteria group bacterium]|nr:tetratricopeptide repeat protein [Patescibacteria group bacterium]